jgi:hypothetical protein
MIPTYLFSNISGREVRLTEHETHGGSHMLRRYGVVLVALGLMLSGCQVGAGDSSESLNTAEESVDVAPATPDELPAPSDTPDAPPPTVVLRACEENIKQDIDRTIGAQTQAFRDGDFGAAYALASPSFQAGIPFDAFARLIRLNYPQLLTADNARSGSCEVDSTDSIATILVRFDTASDPAYTLRYIVEWVGDQWRISGANQETPVDTVA